MVEAAAHVGVFGRSVGSEGWQLGEAFWRPGRHRSPTEARGPIVPAILAPRVCRASLSSKGLAKRFHSASMKQRTDYEPVQRFIKLYGVETRKP